MAITSLKTGIDDHVSRVFINTSHFAEEVEYTEFGKAVATLDANIFDRGSMERSVDGKVSRVRLKELWLHADGVPNLGRQDTFSFEDRTWGVDEQAILKRDGDYVGIPVWTKDPIFVGPNNYRG